MAPSTLPNAKSPLQFVSFSKHFYFRLVYLSNAFKRLTQTSNADAKSRLVRHVCSTKPLMEHPLLSTVATRRHDTMTNFNLITPYRNSTSAVNLHAAPFVFLIHISCECPMKHIIKYLQSIHSFSPGRPDNDNTMQYTKHYVR